MRIIARILLFFLFLLGVGFACLNAEPVALSYYFGQSHFALSLLLVSAFGAGALLGLGCCLPNLIRLKRHVSRLQQRLKVAEQEISNLRSIPLLDRP